MFSNILIFYAIQFWELIKISFTLFNENRDSNQVAVLLTDLQKNNS